MDVMAMAYKIAALAVKQRFAEQHPEDLQRLKDIRRGQVSVYSGSYDQGGKSIGLSEGADYYQSVAEKSVEVTSGVCQLL